MEMPDANTYLNLIKLVKNKEISEAVINKAVGRILKAKFLMGLFENPYVDAAYAEQTVGCQNHRYVALKAAQESIILLKNDNNLLPLDKKTLKSIAVIGPNANRCLLGEYTEKPLNKVTILEGIKAKVAKETQVNYAEGCRITKEGEGAKSDTAKMVGLDINEELIKKAVEVASQSEVVVLVLGSNDQINRNTVDQKHLGDHANLDLPGDQNTLIREITKTGKPVIVYLMNSNPLTLNYAHEKVNTILEGWYAGQETGTAVADIIFGETNPSGHLPVSIPRSASQLPSYYNHKPTANTGYSFEDSSPLYPFGYGLSYTTFTYDAPTLSKAKIKADGKTTVTVRVTNTGKVKGDEVVQLYIRDEISSVTRPIKELKGFKKITLMPNESRAVEFEIGPNELSFYDINMVYGVEKGKFQIMCGQHAGDLKSVELEVE
jgi:beta-glucosidase